MPSGNAVWGIDIGQNALKAIKLRPADEGQVEVVAYDTVEHEKILSQPDADRDELIAKALKTFVDRNELQGDRFVVGVPGQQTFARFCKMPPIDLKKDSKKIHDLVRYEASQQIPFDIDDVVWDYQIFTTEESPNVEVGIFAIRKDLIRKHLGYFAAAKINPMAVQTIPAALYNFSVFDSQAAGDGAATVLVDVGAQNTDLIIVEPNSAWTRNIPLGGNSFTEALVRAFKLSFSKAEQLKRAAANNKYARQIFQAMRPIFADLVAEIQRSVGFYSSTHRDVELRRVLALGNAFRLPGLQKYLENNLTISGGVAKLEKFNKVIPVGPGATPEFADASLSFAAAYGLAVQGLGLARIKANLLPTELARVVVWQRKRPYFIATAAALGLAALVPYAANALDRQSLESGEAQQARANVSRIVQEARRFRDEFQKAKTDTGQKDQDVQKLLKLQDQKVIVPRLIALVNEALPPLNPPELEQVKTPEELKKLIESDPTKFDRKLRGQFVIESLKVTYVPNIDSTDVASAAPAAAPAAGGAPGGAPGGGMPGGAMPGGRGGGRMGGRMAGGGARPTAPPPPTENAGGGEAGAEGAGGFVISVTGRLAYGASQAQASTWLMDYHNQLRQAGARPGLGFFIPPDNAQDRAKRSIGEPSISRYNQSAAGGFTPLQPPVGGQPGAVQFPDPITGEETASDWRVDFAFKVKLGDAPAAAPAEGEAAGGASDAKEPAAGNGPSRRRA